MEIESSKESTPLVERGQGCSFIDASGREILNLSASAFCLPLGYGNNLVKSAALETLDANLLGLPGANLDLRLCDRLMRTLSDFELFFYARRALLFQTGRQAFRGAIKIATEHTCRSRVMMLCGGCHGRSLGQISWGDGPVGCAAQTSPAPDAIYLPFPGASGSRIRGTSDFVVYLHDFVFKHIAHPSEIAALVVPPIQFSESLTIIPDDFFTVVHGLCQRTGIVLIVDETNLSLGVLGSRFACEQWDFQPDILCLGEGFANGLCFGAAITLKSFLDFDLSALDGHSQCQALSAAAAIAMLKRGDAKLATSAAKIEAFLKAGLERLGNSCGLITDIAGKGALWTISLEHRASSDPEWLLLRDEVAARAYSQGLYVAKTGTHSLIIAPPLVISDSALERGLHIIGEVLAHIE
ncbi:aminotransferase class III-fold pyridoxal phosphate-dependent enzyme [bacterium]|nr:aminotransferase class III-fold pyridoxal phosphate-dependent enzyme [bacterium]